jgi:hypothetical protein
MTMVYDQKYWPSAADDRPGMKFGSTVTSIWRVTARYIRAVFLNPGHHSEKSAWNQVSLRSHGRGAGPALIAIST